MPHLPRNFESARKRKKPDVYGEEGELTRNGAFWIKRWTHTHEQGYGMPNRYENASVGAPHLAKYQFWQNKFIHRLFPDFTLDIVAGYDPRIRKEKDGNHSFASDRGKPTTISRHIEASGEMPAQYQDTVHDMYKRTAPKFDEIRSGRPVSDELRSWYDNTWDDTEVELLKMIEAEEFKYFQGNFGDLSDPAVMEQFFQRAEQIVQQVNPQSPILKLLKAGIVPIHPAFNFIPRESENADVKPDGTFIELKVVNFGRAQDYIASLDDAQRPKVERAYDRMVLYNDICASYYQVVIHILQRGKNELINSKNETQLFNVFERVVGYSTKDQPEAYGPVLMDVTDYLQQLVDAAPNAAAFASHLEGMAKSPWSLKRR